MWKSRICRCAGLWKTLGKLLEIPENLVFSLHIFNRTGCGKLLWTFVRTDAAPHRVQRFTGRSFPQHHCTVCGGTAADNDRMPEQRPSPEYSITAAKSKKQNRAVALRCNSHIKFALPLVRAARRIKVTSRPRAAASFQLATAPGFFPDYERSANFSTNLSSFFCADFWIDATLEERLFLPEETILDTVEDRPVIPHI